MHKHLSHKDQVEQPSLGMDEVPSPNRPVPGATYRGYGSWLPDAEVIRLFHERFGCPPRQIIHTGGGVLAGPIPNAGGKG